MIAEIWTGSAALRRRLDAPELGRLRKTMLLWAQQVSRRRLNLDLGIDVPHSRCLRPVRGPAPLAVHETTTPAR